MSKKYIYGNEKNIKISCIIPAYNEEQSIFNTLKAATEAQGFLHEIIVVDDGSTDKTPNIVKNFPTVRLLVNEKNQGKSKAISRGLLESSSQYILLLDADLSNLKAENIIALIQPIRIGVADVVISIRANTPFWMKRVNLDFMSGERVLPRSLLLQHINELMNLRRFGLEVFLNRIIIANKLRIETVLMENVRNKPKWKKKSFWRGIIDEIRMWQDVFKVISVREFISQNIQMRQLLIDKRNTT